MRSMLINKLNLFHADYRMCLIYNMFILSLCLTALVGFLFVLLFIQPKLLVQPLLSS